MDRDGGEDQTEDAGQDPVHNTDFALPSMGIEGYDEHLLYTSGIDPRLFLAEEAEDPGEELMKRHERECELARKKKERDSDSVGTEELDELSEDMQEYRDSLRPRVDSSRLPGGGDPNR